MFFDGKAMKLKWLHRFLTYFGAEITVNENYEIKRNNKMKERSDGGVIGAENHLAIL